MPHSGEDRDLLRSDLYREDDLCLAGCHCVAGTTLGIEYGPGRTIIRDCFLPASLPAISESVAGSFPASPGCYAATLGRHLPEVGRILRGAERVQLRDPRT